jgi:hypothetical protein
MSWADDPAVGVYQACLQKVGAAAVCVPAATRTGHEFTNLLHEVAYDFWFKEDGQDRQKVRHTTQKKTLPSVMVIVEKPVTQ